MQPDPTSLDAIRERFLSYSDHQAGAHARGWPCCSAHGPADDVPTLLAALAEAQRERDEARQARAIARQEMLDNRHRYMRAAEQRDAARADAERMRPVVDAAAVYIRTPSLDLSRPHPAPREAHALIDAVHTYETQEGAE